MKKLITLLLTIVTFLTLTSFVYAAFGDDDNDGLPDAWEIQWWDDTNSATGSGDNDGDLLVNSNEFSYFCNPTNSDTDFDGLNDYEEIFPTFPIPSTYPTNSDTDGDGMPDGWEVYHAYVATGEVNRATRTGTFGLDPLNPNDGNQETYEQFGDSTNIVVGDGFMHLDEYLHGTDPFNADSDRDGIGDYREYQFYGTSPTNADTDYDGLSDYEEAGDEPLIPSTWPYGTSATNADCDGDGLLDGAEVLTYYTYPTNSDTDGDSMPDGWEVQNTLNPTNDDATADFDSDGLNNILEFQLYSSPTNSDTDGDTMSDGDEYIAGTQLTNSASVFQIDIQVYTTTNAFSFEWDGYSNNVYEVRSRTNMLSTNWVSEFEVTGTGTWVFIETNMNYDAKFYYLTILP